jgi:hypothetical protein
MVRAWPIVFCALTCVSTGLLQAGTILDFEGLPDGTFLSSQYTGLTFSNAEVVTAGISLNEMEFPPHSGVNVAIDGFGPISIVFASPVFSVGGYFTYKSKLSLNAYDASSSVIGSISSAFNMNEAISGDAGSSPNEFLQLSPGAGIARLTITGDPAGSSFALDDLVYSTSAVTIPEPSTLAAVLTSLLLFAAHFFRKRSVPAIL